MSSEGRSGVIWDDGEARFSDLIYLGPLLLAFKTGREGVGRQTAESLLHVASDDAIVLDVQMIEEGEPERASVTCMYMESSSATQVRSLSSAWAQVGAVVTAVDARLAKWLDDTEGVGLTEYRAAVHLGRAPDDELRINELAAKLGLNQSSAPRRVVRMEVKGLAVRDTCPDDKRGVYAVLTDRGRQLVASVAEPYEAMIETALRDATSDRPELDLVGLGGSLALLREVVA